MKQLFFLLLLSLPLSGYAQKISKKALKQQERHEQMLNILNERSFAMEAYQIQDRTGRATMVVSITNFVAVQDSFGVVQIALNNGRVNKINLPIREVTEGRVSRYQVIDKGVGKGFDVKFTFFGIFSYEILINVDDKGEARLVLTGNRREYMRLLGNLVPLAESKIYVTNLEGW